MILQAKVTDRMLFLYLFALLQFMKEVNTTEYDGINFYQLTGLETTASQKEVKRSYFRFLKQKKHIENPSENTQKLWEHTDMAYSILGSEYSRALYELFGVDFLNLTDFGVVGYQSDETIEAIIKMVGSAPPEIAEYGGMIYYPLEFELADFLTGARRVVSTAHVVDCECPRGGQNCKQCKKTPFVDKLEEKELLLPKGAPEFYRIIGRGLGDSANGRGAADVVFVATSRPHPVFERKGRDLYTSINVTVDEVLEGKNKTIKGLDDAMIDIPINDVQDGMKRRIKGAGMPDFFNRKERGDLVVTFKLEIPRLSKKGKSMVRKALPDDVEQYL